MGIFVVCPLHRIPVRCKPHWNFFIKNEHSFHTINPDWQTESFTIGGLTEKTVCMGDTYVAGERVKSTGRTGWYFRVFNVEFVERVLPLVLIDRPFPQWTVVHACEIMRNRHEDRQAVNELASCPLLSEDLWIALSERRKRMNIVKQCVNKILKNFRIISLVLFY